MAPETLPLSEYRELAEPQGDDSEAAEFGPFCLKAAKRLLEKDGDPVRIGSRALDILITLVERAPEVVSKRELLKRVWGGLLIDEGTLRYQVLTLRKVLGDKVLASRYIANVAGRGYCFSAPVTRSGGVRPGPKGSHDRCTRLPVPVATLIGRDQIIDNLTTRLKVDRLVSVVGPGGVGKTAVAIQVAHQLWSEFDGQIYFADLGTLAPGSTIHRLLTTTLELPGDASLSWCALLHAMLRMPGDRPMLLVLDNCEHVIDAVAELADSLYRMAPRIRLLATSREPLRTSGEQVVRLPLLESPPAGRAITAAEARQFPAVRLFLQHVAAGGHALTSLSDGGANRIGNICRHLDGLPLALELTGWRVGIYGLAGTESLIVDGAAGLLWASQRRWPKRHRSLYASIDWSYNLLTHLEQLALRRLSDLHGACCLQTARHALMDLVGESVMDMLGRLVEKSLIAVESVGCVPQYRLSPVARAYLLQRTSTGDEKSDAEIGE